MIVEQSKLTRQLNIIDNWWGVAGKGVFDAITGFGKTYVILLIVERMTKKFPNYRTTVIVPSRPLKDAWEKEVLRMKLPNVKVYVVNTYVGLPEGHPDLNVDLLAADEVHHYASEDADFFNKVLPRTNYKYFIGASATLEKEEIQFLARCSVKLFDTVTEQEAEINGWIAPSIVYNLKVPFTEADRKYSAKLNQQFKTNFAKLNHNFGLMMACSGGNKQFKVMINGAAFWQTGKEWREWWAASQGWDITLGDDHDWSPKSIIKYAITGTRSMKERKELLYNVPSKNDVVLQLLDHEYFKGRRIIVFYETQKSAEELQKLRPDIVRVYHSDLETQIINGKKYGSTRLRKMIIEEFEDDNSPITVIACVKALDEGFNVESVERNVQHSYTGKVRRDKQRRGRAGRIDYENLEKVAVSVNLYMDDSQEVKWLKSKQLKAKKAIWIESIDDISLEIQSAKL